MGPRRVLRCTQSDRKKHPLISPVTYVLWCIQQATANLWEATQAGHYFLYLPHMQLYIILIWDLILEHSPTYISLAEINKAMSKPPPLNDLILSATGRLISCTSASGYWEKQNKAWQDSYLYSFVSKIFHLCMNSDYILTFNYTRLSEVMTKVRNEKNTQSNFLCNDDYAHHT